MKISHKEFKRFLMFASQWVHEYSDGTEYRVYRRGEPDPTIFYVVLGEPGLRSCKVLGDESIDEVIVDESVKPIFSHDEFKWVAYTYLKKSKLL